MEAEQQDNDEIENTDESQQEGTLSSYIPQISGLFSFLSGVGSSVVDLVNPKVLEEKISTSVEVVQESLPKVQQTLNHTLKQVPEILGAGQRSLNNIVGNQDLQRVGGQAVETAGN